MMLSDHSKLRRGLLAANLILLFAAATLCRALMLDHVPGLNGDEAWQGVQVQRWLRGEAVSWRTPTGNPINPLSFLPMAALHAWLPPSITLLRMTALISGLAALAVNYGLCRRVFDRQLATISTVILAVLPVMLAYSRFAWDASQSVLVTLPVLYCALGAIREPIHRRGWLIGAGAAWCLSLLVHPTNVFMTPLIVAAAVWCWRKELRGALQGMRRFTVGRRASVAVAIVSMVILAMLVAVSRNSKVAEAAQRLLSPAQATLFAERVVDLLSGTTVYRYIPATQLQADDPATFVYRLAAWATLAAAGYGLFHYLRRRQHASIRVLLVGFGAGLFTFYLVAGPQAIQPHFERYGMWMIGSAALLVALGLRWWMQRPSSLGGVRPTVALLLAWAMLTGFHWYYLRPISHGLGNSHFAFRTAQVEPKLAVLRLIERSQGTVPKGTVPFLVPNNWDSPQVKIIAQGWWMYWPLAYLAGAESRLAILPQQVPGQQPARSVRDAWHVSFVDALESRNREAEASLFVSDAAGRPLLRVVPPGATGTMTQPASLP